MDLFLKKGDRSGERNVPWLALQRNSLEAFSEGKLKEFLRHGTELKAALKTCLFGDTIAIKKNNGLREPEAIAMNKREGDFGREWKI